MKYLSPFLASLFVIVPAAAAWAQEPCGDTTCDQGYVCEKSEIAACPAIACAPDSECDIQCQAEVVEYCKPAPCTSDDQCGDGMVCHTTTHKSCQGATSAPCEAGRDCGVPEERVMEASCTEHTVSQCTPTWQLPCTSDESCGEGFTCEEREACGCSAGSAGSPSSGAGVDPVGSADLVAPDVPPDEPRGDDSKAAPPPGDAPEVAPARDESKPAPPPGDAPADVAPPRDECSCAPTGEFHCVVNHIDCEVDADCPEHWRCAVSSSGNCWADSDGNRGCSDTESRQCLPRAFDVASDARAEPAAGSASGSGEAVDDSALPPQANAGMGESLSESAGAVEPTSKQAAGCSVTSGAVKSGAGRGLSALLALALGAVVSRRRRA